MKLPDAPFIYLVLLTRRGGAQDKCELLDKALLQVANAITALNQAELTFPAAPSTKYLWRIRMKVDMGRTSHYAYLVGANEEYPADDILEVMRELPPAQRADYLLNKDW
jgi:hypothetical protein